MTSTFTDFLSYTSLTDEQLYERMGHISAKIMYARMINNAEMVSQLSHYASAIQLEISERMYRQQYKEFTDTFPAVFNSDPEFSPKKEAGPINKKSLGPKRPKVEGPDPFDPFKDMEKAK